MRVETALNQPKPSMIFIDESSADPNRFGFRDILFHSDHQVYITSPSIEETRRRLQGLVDHNRILPIRAVQTQENLRRGIEYQPALDTLFPRATNLGSALKEKLAKIVSGEQRQDERPWVSLLIFGQQAARPLDIKNALFIMDDQKLPTQIDKVLKMADLLRAQALKLGGKSVLEGWQQYPIGDTYIHEIGGFIHTYEQLAENQKHQFVRIPTLAIRSSHLCFVEASANVPTRTTEPTPA